MRPCISQSCKVAESRRVWTSHRQPATNNTIATKPTTTARGGESDGSGGVSDTGNDAQVAHDAPFQRVECGLVGSAVVSRDRLLDGVEFDDDEPLE